MYGMREKKRRETVSVVEEHASQDAASDAKEPFCAQLFGDNEHVVRYMREARDVEVCAP